MNARLQEKVIAHLAEKLIDYRESLADEIDAEEFDDADSAETEALCKCSIWLSQNVPPQLQDAIWHRALPEWSVTSPAANA